MDITEALQHIIEAKSETIKLQAKYYDDVYGLLVDSLRINAALSGATNMPMEEEPMQEILEKIEDDTSMTGGEL